MKQLFCSVEIAHPLSFSSRSYLTAFKRGCSLLVLFLILFNSLSFAGFSAEISQEDKASQFDSLVRLRDYAMLTGDEDLEAKANAQLEAMGAETMTTAEVAQKVYDTTGVMPCIDVPTEDDKILWTTERFLVNGSTKSYEVQIIYASPTSKESNLVQSLGTLTKSDAYDSAAVAINILKVSTSTVISQNPIGAIIVTALDHLEAVLSGVQQDTIVVSGSEYAYLMKNYTYVRLAFVKDYGQSDDYQLLSYVATRTQTDVSVTFQGITEDNTGAAQTVNAYRTYTLLNEADKYDASLVDIVRSYNGTRDLKSYVTSIPIWRGISGSETKLITIYPLTPGGLAHIIT